MSTKEETFWAYLVKGLWDSPVNWANKDANKIKEWARNACQGFESGRHNEYPRTVAKKAKRFGEESRRRS